MVLLGVVGAAGGTTSCGGGLLVVLPEVVGAAGGTTRGGGGLLVVLLGVVWGCWWYY